MDQIFFFKKILGDYSDRQGKKGIKAIRMLI